MNKRFYNKQNHYSIRKLTIGAASVLIGTSIWLGSNQNINVVHAADNSNNSEQSVEEKKAADSGTPDKVAVNSNEQSANDKEENNNQQTKQTIETVGELGSTVETVGESGSKVSQDSSKAENTSAVGAVTPPYSGY